MNLSHCKDYLNQKIGFCEELLLITREVHSLLEADELDNFEDVMASRGQIIAEIDRLDHVYSGVVNLQDAVNNGFKGEIAKLRDLLVEIQKLDTVLAELIPVKMEDLRREHQQAKSARKVQNAYEGNVPSQTVFVDKKR